MPNGVTLKQVEQQIAQLPPQEQLKLVAYCKTKSSVSEANQQPPCPPFLRGTKSSVNEVNIAGQLSAIPLVAPTRKIEEQTRQARLAEVDAWLAECDAVSESIEGEFDSAEDLRQIREERANQL